MSKEIIFAGIAIIVFVLIVALWVNGIIQMQEKHPDYKGNDLFGEDEIEEHR